MSFGPVLFSMMCLAISNHVSLVAVTMGNYLTYMTL